MTTLRQDVALDADPAAVWDALRDFGAPHERLVRGFVTACESDGRERVLTFFNGMVVRELLVGVDDEHRRITYAITEGFTHYQGTAQVVADDAGCRAGVARGPAAGRTCRRRGRADGARRRGHAADVIRELWPNLPLGRDHERVTSTHMTRGRVRCPHH